MKLIDVGFQFFRSFDFIIFIFLLDLGFVAVCKQAIKPKTVIFGL